MAELARIDAALHAQREALAGARAVAEQIRAEHAAVVKLARDELRPAPPMPDLPDDQPVRDALHRLLYARGNIGSQVSAALAAAVPVVVSGWGKARPDLDQRAAQLAAAADDLAAEYAAWWSLVHEARSAAENADPNARTVNGPSTRMRPRPEAQDVLLAAAGVDLCGVRSARPLVDGVTGHAPRMTSSAVFNSVPSPRC